VKIDTDTGSVSFAGGTIDPRLNRSSFLLTHIGAASKEVLVNADWVHFDITPEADVAGTAVFEKERLWGLLLSFRLPSDESHPLSEDLEQKRKAKHDSWLRIELGAPPYRYPWGEVASEFDPRACASDIILRYAR
jgi:hypothetical protein